MFRRVQMSDGKTDRKKNQVTDNGTEFCNQAFDKYLKANGIRRLLTTPCSRQQNGVAERRNRTLVETA